MDPSSELELTACKKIVVDTAGRIDQTESNELSNRNQQLELELQALREAIMRLEKRVSELESRPDASQSSVRARYARPLRFGRR
jgi:FtsZ-binding cell division protein ZapB